jgi:hypothetical protein
MSQGPRATIAESVRNTMPASRSRNNMHHDPQYYPIRNHLVDFLISRRKSPRAGDRRMDVEILPDFPLVPKAETARVSTKRPTGALVDVASNRKEAI